MNRAEKIAEFHINSTHIAKLEIYCALLVKWTKVKNLVAKSTLVDVWDRHIFDSAQVQRALPEARVWVDFGSGAGFPGLVTAILLSGDPDAVVHLIESDHRKCAFLRDVSRETGLRTIIHCRRVEEVIGELQGVHAISARAVTSMSTLLKWSDPLLTSGAVAVFPKGQEVREELTRIADLCNYEVELKPSMTHAAGRLVIVRRALLGSDQ